MPLQHPLIASWSLPYSSLIIHALEAPTPVLSVLHPPPCPLPLAQDYSPCCSLHSSTQPMRCGAKSSQQIWGFLPPSSTNLQLPRPRKRGQGPQRNKLANVFL